MESHPNTHPNPTTHHDLDHDPLSPVFADSAIDMDVSPPPQPSHVPDDETLERTIRLADRLADLARRTRTADKKNIATAGGGNSGRVSKDDAVVLQRCLDTIQKTLLVFDGDEHDNDADSTEKEEGDAEEGEYDPRPSLTQELTKHRRPQSPTSSTIKSETQLVPSPQPPLPESDNGAITIAKQQQQEKQFTALLDEVSTLGSELDQRRNESFYIYNLFTLQTKRLERRVRGLEDEIRELHADNLQNSIEREGLRGTVYGLESWVDGCQQDHERAVTTSRIQAREAQKKRWTKKRRPAADNQEYDSEREALFEGITAWMCGWKDIEEGFQVRERERELRREERAKMRLADADADANANANVDEERSLQHHTEFHFLMQTQQTASVKRQT